MLMVCFCIILCFLSKPLKGKTKYVVFAFVECSSGYFGYPCQPCGYCDNNGICDPTTGMCPNGCQPGYTGTLCKQSEYTSLPKHSQY